MREIVSHCSYGIDLHTGSNHRQNLPQIRANLSDPETRRCAKAFGAPITIDAKNRDGSLRQAALARGIHCLLYEGGEPMRFSQNAIKVGQEGVIGVMSCLGMFGSRKKRANPTMICGKSAWLRARNGGILRIQVRLGDKIKKGDIVGEVGDAFGAQSKNIVANQDGVVIGITNNPLVYQGDAIVHVAEFVPENVD
jgi:predicted deacylase